LTSLKARIYPKAIGSLGLSASRLVADLFIAFLASFIFILLIRQARVVSLKLKKRNKLRAFNILASLQAGPGPRPFNTLNIFMFLRFIEIISPGRPLFILIVLSPLHARWLPGAVRAASRIIPMIEFIKTVLYFPSN